jgi:hypothetical protein
VGGCFLMRNADSVRGLRDGSRRFCCRVDWELRRYRRVGALLGMKREALLAELRFLLSDGTSFGGARAVVAVAREIWWVRPFVWLAALPGMMPVLDAGYKWIAKRRGCVSQTCELRSRS